MHPSAPNIQSTEASVRTLWKGTVLEKQEAVITKLAGDISEPHLRMYYIYGMDQFPPYIGITVAATKDINYLSLNSTFKDFKLCKGDTLILFFDDGSSFEGRFFSGKNYMDGINSNLFLLPDIQLLHLSEHTLSSIRIISKKANNYLDCHFFGGVFNRQYETQENGKYLLQIMAKRIIGAKQILLGK